VPPIYQPEIIARAVEWASRHRRRDLWVGAPTIKAILGEKFIPGLLDRYLASIGYSTQQTDRPVDPGRPNNLWKPVPADYGARGIFDTRAKTSSVQVWANLHLGWLLAGAGALLAGALMARLAERVPVVRIRDEPILKRV
jgi:hypothetical protein